MRVTAIGDCGIDRYVDVRADRPGGISLNFAVNARRLFAPSDHVGVLTALGNDPEAEVVLEAIARFGIEASVARLPGITPVQYIDREPSGERRFVRYEAGVLAAHRLGDEERALLARSDVMIATVFTQILDFFDTVVAAPRGGLRALDYCNLGTRTEPTAYVERYASHFDIGFFGLTEADGALIERLAAMSTELGRLFIVTLGPGGTLALDGARRARRPAVPVARVVDTTGAGDTFAAGFLSVYAKGGALETALDAGAAAAARTLGHMGAFEADLVPWSSPH
jgi:fructoselysine 6-kinase